MENLRYEHYLETGKKILRRMENNTVFNIGDSVIATNNRDKHCKAYITDIKPDTITLMDANCQKERNYLLKDIKSLEHIPKSEMPKPEIEEE